MKEIWRRIFNWRGREAKRKWAENEQKKTGKGQCREKRYHEEVRKKKGKKIKKPLKNSAFCCDLFCKDSFSFLIELLFIHIYTQKKRYVIQLIEFVTEIWAKWKDKKNFQFCFLETFYLLKKSCILQIFHLDNE